MAMKETYRRYEDNWSERDEELYFLGFCDGEDAALEDDLLEEEID